MTRAAALLLGAILAALAAPALADSHEFSDRYLVESRLLGANGLPLAGRNVSLEVAGETLETPCPDRPHQAVTDEWGDVSFCYLKGALRSGARMTLSSGAANATVALDVTFRHAFVPLRDPTANGTAPAAWNETYRVTGRAWRVGIVEKDGVQLIGVAVPDVPVNLTVRAGAEGPALAQATTADGYGDFGFLVQLPDAGNATLVLEVAGREQSVHLDRATHRSHVPFIVPGPETGAGAGHEPTGAPREVGREPGTSTPPPHPLLLAGIGLALVGAWWLARREYRRRR